MAARRPEPGTAEEHRQGRHAALSGPDVPATACLVKAERALRSARLLLEFADPDGACNRACHAMFAAASAMVLASGESNLPKTHSGVTARFHELLIGTGALPNELGRSLRRGELALAQADHAGGSVSMAVAIQVVEIAERFVSRIGEELPGIHARRDAPRSAS